LKVAGERRDDATETLSKSEFGVTVLGVLFSLTFSKALERGLGGITSYSTIDSIWRSFVATPRQHLFALLQLLAFLLTLFRFYVGAYRFNATKPPAIRRWAVAWNVANTAFLFVGLYVAALLVPTTGAFLLFVAFFHFIDLIWFGVGGPLLRGNPATEKAKDVFIGLDTVTLAGAAFIGLCWLVRPFDSTWLQLWSAVLLIGMFAIDVLGVCRDFYFDPPAWEATAAQSVMQQSDRHSPSAKHTLYFAGPLFTQGERDWNANVVSELRFAGYEVLLPQEQAAVIVKSTGGLTVEERDNLFQKAVSSVQQTDAVIAILDGPDADSGTCFECGYAFSQNKPIIGVRTDLRFAGDDKDRATNLMLGQSARDFVLLGLDALARGYKYSAGKIIDALNRIGL